MQFNRLLDDRARQEFAVIEEEMTTVVPEIIAKKIPRALVQQAFCIAAIRDRLPRGGKVLAVGAFEDPSPYTLSTNLRFTVDMIDHIWGSPLEKWWQDKPHNDYDVVYACSVIEHVVDDETFLRQMTDLVGVGGLVLLTMDWEPEEMPVPVWPGGICRFYRTRDLVERLPRAEPRLRWVGSPDWSGAADFEQYGVRYGFSTYAGEKT